MVKRIKRRIEKPTEDAPEIPEGASGIEAELGALHGEDEFVRRTAGIVGWMYKQRVPLLVGCGALVAVVAVVMYIQASRRSSAEAAAAAFADAAKVYQEARATPRPPLLIPGQPIPPPEPELTPEERRQKLEKAKAAFESTRKENSGDNIALLGTLGLAGAQFDLGQQDAVVGLYDEVVGAEVIDPFTRAVALQGKAAALESAGKSDEAINAWRTLASADNKTYGLIAGVQIGRILASAPEKAKEARAHYEKLLETHGEALEAPANRAYKARIEQQIARLGDAR